MKKRTYEEQSREESADTEKLPYSAPKLVHREFLETTAATCVDPNGFAKAPGDCALPSS